VHHLRVFGCIAYMKITRPHLTKLDDRGLKMVFIGYEPGSKAYRLYDLVSGRVQVSRDVVFDENTFWRWDNPDTEEQGAEPFTVEYLITELDEGGALDYGAPSTTPSRTASPAVPPGTSALTPPLVQ
jgi:hypothetical protein